MKSADDLGKAFSSFAIGHVRRVPGELYTSGGSSALFTALLVDPRRSSACCGRFMSRSGCGDSIVPSTMDFACAQPRGRAPSEDGLGVLLHASMPQPHFSMRFQKPRRPTGRCARAADGRAKLRFSLRTPPQSNVPLKVCDRYKCLNNQTLATRAKPKDASLAQEMCRTLAKLAPTLVKFAENWPNYQNLAGCRR